MTKSVRSSQQHTTIVRWFVAANNRPTRLSYWLLACMAAYLFLVGVLLPPLLRPVFETQLSKNLGSSCTVKALSCNPFTLTLTVHGLSIPYPENKGIFFATDRLEISPSLVTLFRLAPGLATLRITNPVIDITWYKDGSFSPELFVPPGSNTTAATTAEKETTLFPFVLQDFMVSNGTMTFHDNFHNATHRVTDIQISVPFTSTLRADRERAVTPQLNATVNGRKVTIQGNTLPFSSTQRTEFTVFAGDIQLNNFKGYIKPYSPVLLKNGTLSTQLTLGLERDPKQALQVSLEGKALLGNLELHAPNGKPLITVPKAEVEVGHVLFGPAKAMVKEILLENPVLAVTRQADGTLDWVHFITLALAQSSPSANTAATKAQKTQQQHTAQAGEQAGKNATIPSSKNATTAGAASNNAPSSKPVEALALESREGIQIAKIRINNGTLHWADASIPGGCNYTLKNMHLTVSDLYTAREGNANFAFSFSQGKESFSLSGKTSLSPLNLTAQLTAEHLNLSPFSRYLSAATGLSLESGLLHTKGDVSISSHGNVPAIIRFSKGEIALDTLSLVMESDKIPVIKGKKITLGDIYADLKSQTLTLDKLHLAGLVTRIIRQKSGDILLPLPSPSTASKQTTRPTASRGTAQQPVANKTTAPAWAILLKTLQIDSSSLDFIDQALKKPATLNVADIKMTATDISTATGKRWNITSSARVGKSGAIRIKSQGTLTPLRLQFQSEFDKADLGVFSPYLSEFSALSLSEGALSGNLRGTYTQSNASDLTVQGMATVSGLSLALQGRQFLGISRIQADGLQYKSSATSNGTLAFENITVQWPRLNIAYDADGSNTIQKIFTTGASTGKTAQQKQTDKVPGDLESLKIGQFAIKGGRITINDERISPPYALSVDSIAVTLTDMSSDPSSRADLQAEAKINGTPLTIAGKVNPLLPEPVATTSLSMQSLDLRPFSPYAEKFMAYPVQKGTLDIAIDADMAKGHVDVLNKLRFSKLALGDKVNTPGAPDLPVKMAVSLLSDFNGDMNLNIPISGDLSDPQFRTGGIVGKVFANIMLKTVASPFSLLTGIVGGTINLLSGGDGPDLEHMSFARGDYRLTPRDYNTLKTLAIALRQRPSIKLELIGVADATERRSIVSVRIQKKLQELKYDSLPKDVRAKTTPDAMRVGPDVDTKEYTDLLLKVYQSFSKFTSPKGTTLSNQEKLRIIYTDARVSDGDLEDLAEKRAEVVREALLTVDKNLAKRISLGKARVVGLDKDKNANRNGTAGSSPASNGQPSAYVEMNMK